MRRRHTPLLSRHARAAGAARARSVCGGDLPRHRTPVPPWALSPVWSWSRGRGDRHGLCGGTEVSGMTEVFGRDYADAYDVIYRNKNYEGEVDLIERVLVRHGLGGPRRLLDLGCGTGNHVLPLAQRGHAVIGVDRSSGMLARARAKALAQNFASPLVFHLADIRELDLGQHFEAVLMMFTVLG